MAKKKFILIDLFAGAGGTSTGAVEALERQGYEVELTAVNHWDTAIETHKLNHPNARHLCQSIDTINPRDLYDVNEVDGLWASPECMHHSIARGGKPINDQSRATAWCLVRFADALQPKRIWVENVREFRDWGPIGTNGKPLKSKKGDTFRAWIATLESLGYKVEHRIICAADHGDPTSRKRLIVQAVRGRRKIYWPEPTFAKEENNLFQLPQYRNARGCINWDHKSQSIFTRKRPLAENTIKRIEAGLRKFGLEPFLVPQQQRHETRDLDDPMQTIVGSSRGEGICQPFLVQANFGSDCGDNRIGSIDEPVKTVLGSNVHGLAEPFLVDMHGKGDVAPLSEPVPTVTTKQKHGYCEPFLLRVGHYGKNGKGSCQVSPVSEPVKTVTTKQEHALVEAFLITLRNNATCRSLDLPVPTITAGGRHQALISPFLTKFYGNESEAHSVDKPLGTVTTKDRFGLVLPIIEIKGERYYLDIHFRMLQPDELAIAQGFKPGYKFAGNKTQITKQIGNAVPRRLARAVVSAAVMQS